MADKDSSGQPSTVSETAVAPAAASSFSDRVLQAKTPAAIRALKEEAMKPAPVQPAPTAESTPATPAEDPLPTDTPATEETPAAEQAAGEDTPAAPETPETEDEDDGGEGPVTPHSGKRAHLRLADNDEVGRLAASFKKRNRDWTLEQALDAAKKQLGVATPSTAETAAPKTKSDMPDTIEAVQTAEDDLLERRSKEFTALNFEEVAKIDVALRKLDRHRTNLEREGERAQSQQAQDYDRTFDASQVRAAEHYPFVNDPQSAAAKRMLEIDASLKELNDPLFSSADKPFKIAQMVAAEMNIAPKRKGAPAAPAKPAAPVTPAPKKGILPTGASRTTVPVTTKPAIDADIGKIRTVADLRAFRQKMKLPI